MENSYIKIPQFTTINEILNKNYTLSASQYKEFHTENKNVYRLGDLLTKELTRKNLGNDVGTENYVEKSNYTFIKTKALQSNSYTIADLKDASVFIKPKAFINQHLKKHDILVSKDSNVGEAIMLDKDLNNDMVCGAIYNLPIIDNKYYVFSYMKTDLFKEQLNFLVPKGATIKHGKTLFLDCLVPFPNKNKDKIIKYIELMTKSIVEKETLIKEKYNQIIERIDKELKENQGTGIFVYNLPNIKEIMKMDRMDSCLYSKEFKKKEFMIKNYKFGYKTIADMDFEISRGQNLQVSNIGKSIQSNRRKNGYYRLVMPNFITKYGTISTISYLGNQHKLKVLNVGDLIFGAEGNEKGRSYVVIENTEKTITNIHGITINHHKNKMQKSIFIKLFLDYYRYQGMIDDYAVGGNGGSLAIKYWDYLKFPEFPEEVEKEIVNLYTTSVPLDKYSECDINSFIDIDNELTKQMGIYELDKTINMFKDLIKDAFIKIADDKEVEINFKI